MENAKGNELLMTVLRRVSQHYKIEGAETLGFKKRSVLLDRLKESQPDAWKATHELIESQLRTDRILADKEKEQKNPEVWKTELEQAKANRATAGEAVLQLFKSQGISTDQLQLND